MENIGVNPGDMKEPSEADSVDLEVIKKEFSDYFGIESPKVEIVVVPSREKFDKLRNQKTESWQVGTTIDNTAYILHPDVWKAEGFHNPEEFPTTVKHETVHVFFRELSSGNNYPFWLNEGIAYYLCEQKRKIRDIEDPTLPSDVFKANNKSAPRVGYRMVEGLTRDFGKEKVTELIRDCKPGISQEEFDQTFESKFGMKPNGYYLKILAETKKA
jgi:hypothetical protein